MNKGLDEIGHFNTYLSIYLSQRRGGQPVLQSTWRQVKKQRMEPNEGEKQRGNQEEFHDSENN